MQIRNILVPVDIENVDLSIVRRAEAIARWSGATVHLMHVVDPALFVSPTMIRNGQVEEVLSYCRSRLEELTPVGATVTVEMGKPGPTILKWAKAHDIDLIVLSTHARRGADRFFLGSVAEYVIRRADCPVITARNKSCIVPEVSARYSGLLGGTRPEVYERDEWRALVWKPRR